MIASTLGSPTETVLPNELPEEPILSALRDSLVTLTDHLSKPNISRVFFKQVTKQDPTSYRQIGMPTLYELYKAITQKGWEDREENTLPGFPQSRVAAFTTRFEALFLREDSLTGQGFTDVCWSLDALQVRDRQHRIRWRQARAQLDDAEARLESVSELGELALLQGTGEDTSTVQPDISRAAQRLAQFGQFGKARVLCPSMSTAAENKMRQHTLWALDQVQKIYTSLGLSVPTISFSAMAVLSAREEIVEVSWT